MVIISNEQQDGVNSIVWAGLNKVDGTWRMDRIKRREVRHVFHNFCRDIEGCDLVFCHLKELLDI